ncbi:hypothetical protein L1D37_09705 [Vibrio sp. Isolate33]|uniref:hypothetical protein n=1 Tax=Vibrio sp. Isolate33 TaxID=2908539 RepID=UPI001EFE1F7F|nr:hypothetical protein [Vibrio sp. Isolate33]MCG9544044.1 hypothetical protein [Vibrio sp. Isolate33]
MDKEQVVEIVKEVFNYQLIDGWAYIILFVVTLVGTYLGAGAKKSGELKAVNDNFDELLRQQRILTENVTKIKQDFEKENIVYQIKMSDFNVRSLEAIELVFSKLVDIKKCARQVYYAPNQDYGKDLYAAIEEFRDTYDVKKIWIPKKIADELEEVAIELGNKASQFLQVSRSAERATRLSDQQLERIFGKQEDFYNYMDNESRKIFEKLSDKIRMSSLN